MPHLDGPRIVPRHRAPSSLVVLLHGYGASGDDLIGLAEAWRPRFPDTVFVSPHAPQALDAGFGGYQWFPLTFRDPGEYWRGVNAAGPALERFLDAELARYAVAPERLALVGFSQGTMMALHSGLRRGQAPAAIVGFSGMVAGPEHLGSGRLVKPPVLLIHGEADSVIPIEALHVTREALARAGLAVEWHVAPALDHGIDAEGVACAAGFLARALSG
jgi:phospholipase/carboxylesterase